MNNKINEKSMAARLIKAQRDIDGLKPERDEGCDDEKNICGGCRRQCFCISETEFALIFDYLTRNISEKDVLEIISRAKAQWEKLKTHCPAVAEMLEGIVTLEELLKTDKITLPFSCVFYSESDGGCLIYEVRPLICRAYGIGLFEKTVPDCGRAGRLPDFYRRILSFLFLGNAKGGCVIIRRPAPLFYYFNMIFKNTESGKVPEIEFCRDLLCLSEEEYVKKLVETWNPR